MGRASALFACYGGADTTAPVLSSAQSTSHTDTTAALSVATDTANGTMWWVVALSTATAPNATQIRAGTDGDSVAAVATNATGGTSVSASPFTASATGLSASTAYKVHFTQDDLSSNHSSVASSSSFTTDSGSFDADTTTWAAQVVTNGGTVSSTSKGYVDTLIKAIKADSNLGPNLNSVLDRMWLFANFDTTGSSATTDAQALTSIVNPGSTATPHGSWTSNTLGWQGNGSTGYIDTGFNMRSGTNFTQNSAAFGVYCLTSRTTNQTWLAMGGSDGTSNFSQLPGYYTAAGGHAVNDTGASAFTVTAVNSKGLHMLIRTAASGSNCVNCRQYVTSSTATVDLGTVTSGVPPNLNMVVCCQNNNGSTTGFTTDKMALAFISGKLTATQADSLAGYINTYMTSLGINVY